MPPPVYCLLAFLILRARFFSVRVGDEAHTFGPGNLVSALLRHLELVSLLATELAGAALCRADVMRVPSFIYKHRRHKCTAGSRSSRKSWYKDYLQKCTRRRLESSPLCQDNSRPGSRTRVRRTRGSESESASGSADT